jgi:putative endonuclease
LRFFSFLGPQAFLNLEVYYIYILQSTFTGLFYCGYSDDPWRRKDEHNTKPHNTYTSKYRPWILVAVFECGDHESQAVRIERFIKKQKSRKLIEKLINPSFLPTGYLAQLVRVPHPA